MNCRKKRNISSKNNSKNPKTFHYTLLNFHSCKTGSNMRPKITWLRHCVYVVSLRKQLWFVLELQGQVQRDTACAMKVGQSFSERAMLLPKLPLLPTCLTFKALMPSHICQENTFTLTKSKMFTFALFLVKHYYNEF